MTRPEGVPSWEETYNIKCRTFKRRDRNDTVVDDSCFYKKSKRERRDKGTGTGNKQNEYTRERLYVYEKNQTLVESLRLCLGKV